MPYVNAATQTSADDLRVDAATQTSPDDVVDQSTSAGTAPAYRPCERKPMIEWQIGSRKYRRMFPLHIIPRELNPNHTLFDRLEDFPLVWFGVPFDRKKVMNYACSRGYGVFADPDDDVFDFLGTWNNFIQTFRTKWDVYISLQEVWGQKIHLLTFYSNRDLWFLSKPKREFLFQVIENMGFSLDDAMWYVDRYETI